MYFAYGIFDNVGLAAKDGTLTISGQVTQPFKKTDIGRLVTCEGSGSGREQSGSVTRLTFDDRLRLQVARAIYGDPYFMRYANQALPPIHIIVKNGDVTLEGVVASAMDRTKAEMAARRMLSFGVVNNLRIANT